MNITSSLRSFEQLGLNPLLLHGIRDAGFTEPAEIQQEAIPLILQGEDLVGQAKTGTGKTAAFALPIIQLVAEEQENVKALIVVPVRELSQQVTKETHLLGKHVGIRTATIYGGQSMNLQINALRKKPQIVVGTPGRLLDLYRRRSLNLSHVGIVVLDEADKMFEMGFREDIEEILKALPSPHQTLLFSATMRDEIKQLARRFMRVPVEVNLSQDTLTVEGIKQYYLMVHPRKRILALLDILKNQQIPKAIVFCRTKRTVDWLSRELHRHHIPNTALHGNFTQVQRERTLDEFKHGHTRLLIATNLAARGLHIEDITHVINFEMPDEDETYIHRIGRTARQGKTGVAITFLENMAELRRLQRIQQIANSEVQEIDTPHKY